MMETTHYHYHYPTMLCCNTTTLPKHITIPPCRHTLPYCDFTKGRLPKPLAGHTLHYYPLYLLPTVLNFPRTVLEEIIEFYLQNYMRDKWVHLHIRRVLEKERCI